MCNQAHNAIPCCRRSWWCAREESPSKETKEGSACPYSLGSQCLKRRQSSTRLTLFEQPKVHDPSAETLIVIVLTSELKPFREELRKVLTRNDGLDAQGRLPSVDPHAGSPSSACLSPS
jgi:hypothetical protein